MKNRRDRKESARRSIGIIIVKELSTDSESSISKSRATWVVFLLLGEILLFVWGSDDQFIDAQQ